jgi:Protein of unknown function (DUF2793)
MDSSPNLILPYIIAAQAQKHVTHNEALRGLDALVQLMVLDKDLSSPPGSPADGDRYIVAASPTGAWSGQAGKIAAWQDGAWAFYTPREGWRAWLADEDKLFFWDGSDWIAPSSGGGAAASAVGLHNGKIAESHASSAATFALKTLAGADPSGGDPVTAIFPDGSSLSITAALSVTIPSTATMGFTSGAFARLWAALANDAGTPRLVVRNCRIGNDVVGFPSTGKLTSTTIGTGADSAQVSYSDAGVADKPYLLAAYADYDSGLATAGTWDASPTRIVQFGPGVHKPSEAVQAKSATQTASTGVTNATPVQTGTTVSITPTSKHNVIRLEAVGGLTTAANSGAIFAQWSRGASPTLIGASVVMAAGVSAFVDVAAFLLTFDAPGATSSTTYYVYIFGNGGLPATFYWNRLGATTLAVATEIMG